MRRTGLALAALLTSAAAPPPVPPPLPEALKPYIIDGRYEPGDYGWMRGAFVDPTPADRERFRSIMAWATQCREATAMVMRPALERFGVDPDNPNASMYGRPLLCLQAFLPRIDSKRTVAEFARAVEEARPVADAFFAAIALAGDITRPRSASLAEQLPARRVVEQMLRRSNDWGYGPLKAAPTLTPDAMAIFRARVTSATMAVDHTNTEWLKQIVAKKGWPRRSQVGEIASNDAWLLAQHADNDPLFQLSVLRLMEPLVAAREVSPANYAYLYDRVTLKMTGKQRYATQVTCEAGKRVPLPLETPAAVAKLRAELGLEPVEAYIARMDASGACPAA